MDQAQWMKDLERDAGWRVNGGRSHLAWLFTRSTSTDKDAENCHSEAGLRG
jgi:hypothetical protein